MLLTRNDVAEFVKENAVDVADLAAVDQMEKTDDPRLARMIERELRQKYEDAAIEADRDSLF